MASDQIYVLLILGLVVGLFLWGVVYRWFDNKWTASLEWRVALLCIAAPRVFADQGMGISAFAISITSIAGFLIPLAIFQRLVGLGAHRTRV